MRVAIKNAHFTHLFMWSNFHQTHSNTLAGHSWAIRRNASLCLLSITTIKSNTQENRMGENVHNTLCTIHHVSNQYPQNSWSCRVLRQYCAIKNSKCGWPTTHKNPHMCDDDRMMMIRVCPITTRCLLCALDIRKSNMCIPMENVKQSHRARVPSNHLAGGNPCKQKKRAPGPLYILIDNNYEMDAQTHALLAHSLIYNTSAERAHLWLNVHQPYEYKGKCVEVRISDARKKFAFEVAQF